MYCAIVVDAVVEPQSLHDVMMVQPPWLHCYYYCCCCMDVDVVVVPEGRKLLSQRLLLLSPVVGQQQQQQQQHLPIQQFVIVSRNLG